MKKNDLRRSASEFLWLIIPAFLYITPLAAQSDKVRTIEKTVDGKTALWVSHRYGELVLKKGSGNQIKAVLVIKATGKDGEETQQFLDKFDLDASDAPDNKLDIKTSTNIKSWNKIGNKSTVKFKDGSTFSGIQHFNMRLEVYVPKLRYATLDNAYEATSAAEGTADLLEIKQYEGTVDAPGNFDQLKLDFKYTKGNIGNFKSCDAQMYESKITLGSGDYLKLEAKYSEFAFSGNLGAADLLLYETKIDAQNAGDIRVTDSKYSKFRFREINALHFKSAYESDVRLVKVGSLRAEDSKYTEYEVDGLWKDLKFPSSYEDDIIVHQVGSTFEGLTLEGKYTDVTLPIPVSVKYEIDAAMVYGKITYAESTMENTVYVEKNDHITLKAKSKGAGPDAVKVLIKTYEGKIKLN